MCMECGACGPGRDDYSPFACSGCDCGLDALDGVGRSYEVEPPADLDEGRPPAC